MTLSKRPTAEKRRPLGDQEIDRLIRRGAEEAETKTTGRLDRPITLKVRFYDAGLHDRLRRAVEAEPGRLSVNTWIMQAIHERLERLGREG